MGKWKAIRREIFEGNMAIELYNLETDISEQQDLAGSYPKIVEQIAEIMKTADRPSYLERFKFPQLGD